MTTALELERLLAGVSSALANADRASLDDAICGVLASLGRHLGAQRVFLALALNDRGDVSVRYEWHAEGRTPLAPAMQRVPNEMFSWLMDTLDKRGWASVESPAELPAVAAAERALMEQFNAGSGRAVQLKARGRFLGLVGCLFERPSQQPIDDEHLLLSLVSEMCASAIARQEEADAKNALLDLTRDLSGTFDLNDLLARVQPTIASRLGCDGVALYYAAGQETDFALIAAYGFDAGAGPEARSGVRAGHPLYDILRSGNATVINDPGAQEWHSCTELEGTGIGFLVIAPLVVRGDLRGVAYAGRRPASRPFTSSEVGLFEGMARQISLAVHNAEIYRAKEAEAAVASALVRAGREALSSLDRPVLLERLTQLAADILDCEFSHTYLWNEKQQCYSPAAAYGVPPENWEAMRVLRIPVAQVRLLTERLRRDDVVSIVAGKPDDLYNEAVARGSDIKTILYIALRRGSAFVGAIAAGRRESAEPFTQEQIRIAQGIGQLASLTLANAKVVEELEELGRLKSDFVATMSHELRTPLNAIIGYSELLMDGELGPLPAEQLDFMRRMRRSAAQLCDLVNATLDVGRLEAGRLPVSLQQVQPADLLAQIECELQQDVKTGVQLVWDTEDDLPELLTDPMKVKVVVKNIVGNALKFTERGVVRVATAVVSGGIEIAVSDTGIGIPVEAQQIVFEAFRQVDGSSTRRHGGVGLGLFIVSRLLGLLGGSITLESDPGRGSTFRVWLPIDTEAALRAGVGS